MSRVKCCDDPDCPQCGWTEYLQTHQLNHVTINPDRISSINLLPYFQNPDGERYDSYAKWGYTRPVREFYRSAKKIHETLQLCDTSIIELQSDPLFKAKEWGQLCSIIKDIYIKGNKNIPTLRWNSSGIIVHPGNHLAFAMLFLGKPMRCFFTCHNDYAHNVKKISTVHETIWNPTQIQSILKTKDIEFWIEHMDGQMVPHLYPRISRETSWKSYQNGDCEWPWQEVEKYNNDPVLEFDLESAVPKREFKNEKILKNNQFAFLLTGAQEDANFALCKTSISRWTRRILFRYDKHDS